MRASNSPMCLWDYAIERRAMIHNIVPHPLFQNNGLTPHAVTFGESGDISNICIFAYFEWVYYRDHGSSPDNKENLAVYLAHYAMKVMRWPKLLSQVRQQWYHNVP